MTSESKNIEDKDEIKEYKDIKSVKFYLPKNLNTNKVKQLKLMREQYIESVRHHMELGWIFQSLTVSIFTILCYIIIYNTTA